MKEEKEKNQPPVKTLTAGPINVAIWKNQTKHTEDGQHQEFHSVTFERRYKDKDGQWKSSGSFSRNEIPLVQYVLAKAFEAMVEEGQGSGETGETETVR